MKNADDIREAEDRVIRDVTSMSVTDAVLKRPATAEETFGVFRVIFTAFLVIVALYIVYTATGFESRPRIMPLTFGVPMLVLSTIELIRDLAKFRWHRGERADRRFNWPAPLYLAAATGSVVLLGTLVGGIVLLIALAKLYGKSSTRTAIVAGLIGGGAFHILATVLLNAQYYRGILNL